MLLNFFIFYFFILILLLESFFFLEFWKISKVTPKRREQRRIYIYIYIRSQPLPSYYSPKKNFFQSKFIISFSQLVISHELGAVYFDISFFIFHCCKINGILFFLFLLCRYKSIMFRRCFPLELSTYILNISKIGL